jgi:hypothetical protein
MAAETYDVVTGLYATTQGATIDPAGIRQAVDVVIDAQRAKTAAITERLRTGALKLHEWESQMHADLKALHVAIGTIANGGTAQMSPAAYGALGAELKKQYQYLNRFAIQVAAGYQPINGTLLSRADLYVEAARTTYADVLHRQALIRGQQEARRVLGSAEHCDGCVTQAGKGWVPIGEVRPIGSQQCRARCRCSIEYRQAA